MTDKSEIEIEDRLAEELYEHRHDPGEWSEEAVDVEVRPSKSAMVSFRLPRDELVLLSNDATASGLSLSDFIRDALRLRRMVSVPALPMSVSLGATPLTKADGPNFTFDMSGLFPYYGWFGFTGSPEPRAVSTAPTLPFGQSPPVAQD